MLITDRVNRIKGVQNSFWQGESSKLTVYYYDNVPVITIKVRVADALRNAGYLDAIDNITLLSVPRP